jgi:L-threonylcarbamoyladenylate synthase
MHWEKDNIKSIENVIENDGTILYPTDTIWGIGCSALSDVAIQKVINIKGRTPEKGFVVLVESIEMLKNYVKEVNPKIETLLSHHKRPLTVIYDCPLGLSPLSLAPDGTVAIRIAQDDFCKELIWACGVPLISTSANYSGNPFPANFGEIQSDILNKVDYVVKHRQSDKSKSEPSTIVKVTSKKELEFIRN